MVQYLLLGMGLAGPSMLLLAAGCGYWLASRAMRPVRLMTQAAREIEETDLSRRLHLQSQDELGEVCVQSEVGQGSRFEVWLPLLDPE